MKYKHKIGAVIVQYGDRRLTELCRQSLENGTMVPKIQVIDNNVRNIGYGAACNLGFHLLNDCEKVIFLNNDVLVDRWAVAGLYKSKYDYVCPKILDMKGDVIYCGGKIKRGGPWHDTRSWVYEGETEFLQGACICVKSDKWIGFDESYFMYFEDVDLSLRVRKSGYTMGFNGGITVKHDHKRSPNAYYWCSRNYRKAMGNDLYYWLWWLPKRVVWFWLTGKHEYAWKCLEGAIDSSR